MNGAERYVRGFESAHLLEGCIELVATDNRLHHTGQVVPELVLLSAVEHNDLMMHIRGGDV